MAQEIANLMKKFGISGFFALPLAAALGGAVGNLLSGFKIPAFQEGGLIGGRRHSQGGTMLEAERGEFIMNRNAVDAVGIEGMEAINEGGGIGTTVNINNPIISSEFVEEELPELIAEAIRKGANFGLS